MRKIIFTCEGCGKDETVADGGGLPDKWATVSINVANFTPYHDCRYLTDIKATHDLCVDCQLRLRESVQPRKWVRENIPMGPTLEVSFDQLFTEVIRLPV